MTDTITGSLSSRVEKQDSINYAADVEGSLLSDKIGVALTPQVAPQASVKLLNLIGTVSSSDVLRLSAPQASNSFTSGTINDHVVIRNFLKSANQETSKILQSVLAAPLGNVTEGDVSHFKAALAREDNMCKFLKSYNVNAETIVKQLINAQE